MPEYDVIGADRRTGQERRTTVLAADEAEAARLVERHLLVERIVVVPTAGPAYLPGSVPASPSRAAAASVYAPAPTAPAAAAVSGPSTPSPAAAPQQPPADPPRYLGIRVGASVLRIVGGLMIAAGLVLLGIGVARWAKLPADEGTLLALAAVVQGTLTPVVLGVLAIFVADVGSAVGDAARNSFR